MIVFPAIDLIAGKVVRLERGDRARMKVYSDDPAAVTVIRAVPAFLAVTIPEEETDATAVLEE